MPQIFNFSKQGYPNPNPSSTQFEIDNWYMSQIVVEKIVPQVGLHPFPLNELLLMAGVVARFRPKLIFEWGTHIGKSAKIFHDVSETLNIKTTIHSIDLPEEVDHIEHPHEQRGKLVRGHKRVKLHEGDGIVTALHILAKQKGNMQKGEGVLFFLDGDHLYKSVKRELTSIIKNVPESAILLHDSFYQSRDANYNVGVHKAINDCLRETSNIYKRVDTNTGLPGMTLLYK